MARTAIGEANLLLTASNSSALEYNLFPALTAHCTLLRIQLRKSINRKRPIDSLAMSDTVLVASHPLIRLEVRTPSCRLYGVSTTSVTI